MNATSRAIVQSVLSSDKELTIPETEALERALSGQSPEPTPSASGPTQLLTQRQVAQQLCLSRATVWRLTKQGIFHPVEVTPSTLRYRSSDIEAFARNGLPRKPARGSRPTRAKVAA